MMNRRRTKPEFMIPTVGNDRGLSMTIPMSGKGIREQISRLKAGTITEKLGYFYDDAFHFPDEVDPVDVSMMTIIERKMLLAEKRRQLENWQKDHPLKKEKAVDELND